MKKFSMSAFLLAIGAPLFLPAAPTSCPPPFPGPAGADEIHRVPKDRLKIDGRLDDWAGMTWHRLVQTPSGGAFVPSEDLDVRVAFAFDAEKFYIAVSALDNAFETVDRGWRYGDGFYWTLLNDDRTASPYQIQLGFAKGQKTLVYKNGVYFLRAAPAGVDMQFSQDGRRCDYEIAVPLAVLKPFEPFVHESRAMNIVYVDRDGGRITNRAALTPDIDYDTESTPLRRGRAFRMAAAPAETPAEAGFHGTTAKNYYRTGAAVRIDYAFDAFAAIPSARLRLTVESEARAAGPPPRTMTFKKGLDRGAWTLDIGDVPSGAYQIRARLTDGQDRPVADYREDVFILNEKELGGLKSEADRFRSRPELASSLPVLDIRFEWISDFYKGSGFDNIGPLSQWGRDIDELMDKLRAGRPALFEPGQVRRLAHRSALDGTLQPYSVSLPADFDPGRTYPLIVGLHGSGVDESNVIGGFSARLRSLGCPILAPKARGLSDFYVGASGADVFECIDHFCALYPNIDKSRITLLGFSMGGYGVWRLGLLRPGYFKGLIVMSGAVIPRPETGGENILDLIDRAKGQHLLIVHGAKDDAVPIDMTRRAVARLKELGVDFEYLELPEAAHGNYDRWADILDWIRRH